MDSLFELGRQLAKQSAFPTMAPAAPMSAPSNPMLSPTYMTNFKIKRRNDLLAKKSSGLDQNEQAELAMIEDEMRKTGSFEKEATGHTLKFHGFTDDVISAFDKHWGAATGQGLLKHRFFHPADKVQSITPTSSGFRNSSVYEKTSEYPRHLLIPPAFIAGGGVIGAALGRAIGGEGAVPQIIGGGAGIVGSTALSIALMDALRRRELNKLRTVVRHKGELQPKDVMNLSVLGNLIDRDKGSWR